MKRRLVVSVGTSLFHSASWRNEGPFALIRGYAEWLRPPQIGSPSKRSALANDTNGAAVEAEILNVVAGLEASNSGVIWFDTAHGNWDPAGRYSAEITTLVAMRRALAPDSTLAAFLEATYDQVDLLAAESHNDESHIAGRHLQRALAAHSDCKVRLVLFEGASLGPQVQSIVDTLLERTPERHVDLVVSGGYKAFAVAMGHVYWQRARGGSDWRLFYLHEKEPAELVQEWFVEGVGVITTDTFRLSLGRTM